jgi:hypothetical protein
VSYVHQIADQVAVLVGDTTQAERCQALGELLRLFRQNVVGTQCHDAAAEAALYALGNRREGLEE